MLSLLGVPLAFLAILLLVRKRVSYGISIFAGALIIGVFCRFTPRDFLTSGIETLRDPETLNLTAIIILIGILGYAFKETGHITITIEELRKLFGEKALLAALPAAFGMLPMPGGALMSAPVIEPEANRLGLSPEHKTYINIWFRHTLLLIFPLSSMIILSASLTGTTVYQVIGWLIPLFFLSVAVGYVTGLKSIKTTPHEGSGSFLRALYGLSPIIVVIVLNLFHVGFAIGLVVGILLLFVLRRVAPRQAVAMVVKGFSLQMAVAMVGIMFFRQVINTSPIVGEVMHLVEGSPVYLLMVGLPFLISVLTGLALLSAGVSFPLLIPLSPFPPSVLAAVLYTSSFTGYLASPLHLCLIVTKEYFKSSLFGAYKRFLPSVAVLFLYNICFTVVYLWLQ